MIIFKRDDKNLMVSISSELTPKANIYNLSWGCGDDCYADLLQKHLNELLRKKITQARKESYEEGYKDGKSHKTRQTWFKNWL